jgi:hypothetical protein
MDANLHVEGTSQKLDSEALREADWKAVFRAANREGDVFQEYQKLAPMLNIPDEKNPFRIRKKLKDEIRKLDSETKQRELAKKVN